MGKRPFPRRGLVCLRSVMLNHWCHHQGRLSVYLRLLDVLVAAIYGRGADDNPFSLRVAHNLVKAAHSHSAFS